MQAVIAIKTSEQTAAPDTAVCGLPLLARVILVAARSGCGRILLLCPPSLPAAGLLAKLRTLAQPMPDIDAVDLAAPFDERDADAWRQIATTLEHRFLWLPWGYIPHRNALSELLVRAALWPNTNIRFNVCGGEPSSAIFDTPSVLLTSRLTEGRAGAMETVVWDDQVGVYVHGAGAVAKAERELVRRSGKATDGIYSRFNRKLCRLVVRWLSRTRITPNAVTWCGLVVAMFGGILFARGSWINDIAGALLFFLSGLVDEVDGMVARLKFQDSPFGCWLETMVDYASYVLIFTGITIGAAHQYGRHYLALGVALVFGSVVSFWVVSIQRRLAAPADRPNEYSSLYLAALDKDSRNLISASIRQLQFLTKKGVLIHYLLLFAVFRLIPGFLMLAAAGANITWMVTVYFNARLFSGHSRAVGTSQHAAPER